VARDHRRPGGLGRPLDSIIAGARAGPDQWSPGTDRMPAIDAVIAAGLDALDVALDLDLAGYLHVGPDRGPHLTVRMARPIPDDGAGFEMLAAAAAAMDGDRAMDRIRLLGIDVVTVLTAGHRSRGVHLIGRLDPPLAADERDVARRLCLALGGACHTVEEAWTAPVSRPFGGTGAERTAS
jgi:hypothetical protein